MYLHDEDPSIDWSASPSSRSVSEEKVISLGNNLGNIDRRRWSKKIGQGTAKKENVWQKYVITLLVPVP